MRIDLTSSGPQQTENAGSQKTGQRGTDATEAHDTSQTGATGDSTQFSFDQTRIHSLAVEALSAPEIRQATVSSLARSISTGEYSVDAAKVAGAIVSAYSGDEAH